MENNKQSALDAIADAIAQCTICQKDAVGLPVPGEGNPDADVVFIGEAPGKEEAATGRPFVGRSGQLLRELIRSIGLKEEEVYITSPVKYLPKHVTPREEEIVHGRNHLVEQFKIIDPKIIVLLGRVAALAVLGQPVVISKHHGRVLEKNHRRYLITFHPAAPLYSPKVRAELEADFRILHDIV